MAPLRSRISRFVLMVLLALAPGAALGQPQVPEFQVDAMARRGAGATLESRLDVYVRIPYERLRFVNSVSGFTADYQVTVEALAREGNRLTTTPVETRVWEGTARVVAFKDTRENGASAFTTQSLNLAPGVYQLSVQVEDRNADQSFVRDLTVRVRDFNRQTALSDLTLLESYDRQTLSIVPRTSGLVSTDEGTFDVFFEAYTGRAADYVLRHTVTRLNRESAMPATGLSRSVVGEVVGDITDTGTSEVILSAGLSQHVIPIPMNDPKVGAYVLRMSLEDSSGLVLDEASLAFSVRWSGLDAHMQDIEQAITQLEYIAKKKDIGYILEATTEAEKTARFRAFWDRRDPSPGTRRNEMMEEYYYRVNYANRRYGTAEAGWKTDRGFVMVRFGEPDYVERKPHSFDYEPYEIWVYQRMGRKFIFVDKTGFGDYELLVPVWDERTRLY